MARNTFAIQLTSLEGNKEYIVMSNVCRLSSVEEDGGTPRHTLIQWGDGYGIKVIETVEQIEQKGAQYGIFKIVGK